MELKLYKSPGKVIRIMLLSSVFVTLGMWLLATDTAPAWIGWLNIVFFGLAYPIGLYQLIDRKPQLILSEHGIFDRTIHEDCINWELIQNAYPISINGMKFVCLVVDDAFKPSKHKGSLYKGVARLNEAMGAQELTLNLAALRVDEVRLTELILAMRTAAKPERKRLLALSLI